MGARTKLNSANVMGSLIVATLIGTLAGSWVAFLITLTALVVCALSDGSIRMTSRRGK